LYGLYDDFIQINPIWINYLVENSKILKDFCYWNLSLYLQKRNPNVPDIPNKLIQPATRKALAQQRSKFWDIVIKEHGDLKCIYTGKTIKIGEYAVEHFVPYSFVSHDLIWNLIPADKVFNSSKSDKLPSIEKYFNPFFNLQKTAIEIINAKSPKNIFLEDYSTIFPDINEISALPNSFTKEKFKEKIQPLITIASNNGFEFL
jgi:5-methylcytosine-specific restriction endonuclease McrA